SQKTPLKPIWCDEPKRVSASLQTPSRSLGRQGTNRSNAGGSVPHRTLSQSKPATNPELSSQALTCGSLSTARVRFFSPASSVLDVPSLISAKRAFPISLRTTTPFLPPWSHQYWLPYSPPLAA